MRPVKKKMKRLPEVSERAKHLRESLDMNQSQFAEHIGIARPRISEWEAGKGEPSPGACVLLGNAAQYPENLWFWEQAGFSTPQILSVAETILKSRAAPPLEKEIVRVPRVKQTPEGTEEEGDILLPAEFVPKPLSTRCLEVDSGSAGFAFGAGDIVAVEPPDEEEVTGPFWDQVVLVDFKERKDRVNWPVGLFMGVLRCSESTVTKSGVGWVAEIAPLSSEVIARPIMVGSFSYRYPPLPPGLQGTVKGRVKDTHIKHGGKTYGPGEVIEMTTDEAVQPAQSGSLELDPEGYARVMRVAEFRARELSRDEVEEAREQAKKLAPMNLRLYPACKLVGRVVLWLRPPPSGGNVKR